MTLSYGPVTCALDLDSPGKRAGYFSLTHSDNRHEFSEIPAPLAVIRCGDGPTALVCAGNHGDEYEGQIITRRLFERLDPEDVTGRLILAPALNTPAVLDAARVSPLDQGNMNRSFPGAEDRGPTAALAGFVTTHLMPRAQIALDLHSGGSATDYLDCAYFCLSHDKALNGRTRELVETLALPYTFVVPPGDTAGDFDAAAQDAGCAMLSCELGGEGKVSLRALEAGWKGVLRVLAHEGVITAKAAQRLGADAAQPTAYLDFGAGAYRVTARHHGLAEPLVQIGEPVAEGQTVALLHDVHDLDAAPVPLVAQGPGRVAVRRHSVLVRPGDHLFEIAPELGGDDLERLLRAI
ncbi:succinylglutamate desuccinylase/aspartoacylase family protein [Leisingera caerulea]|jgi:predicted deacylase|uniref:succinylglutamate desuccinylase/aspartoacylase family protein n=1 Tax=Leisingera caerulea TaxID=506591 RepID=UPI0021A82467|nr:succinylglutamate desuccinylase/aspartoacylase family protein [Leisingera caerulea]UWQ86312.1 succinylglutamate desuccinylase/aspartoacylase family protein [Leisingera caerulea]